MSKDLTEELVKKSYAKWSPLAADAAIVSLTAPVAVILGEAAEIAMLYRANWKHDKADKKGRVPSFSDVSERWAVYEELGSEIYKLHTAVLYVHADYVSATELKEASPMVRAEFVLAELKATLEFLFDDGEHTVEDDKLEKIGETYASPTSQDVMAAALDAYWKLASDHRESLDDIGVFDTALIDEALALSGKLRDRSGEALLEGDTSGVTRLLDERNRLLALLLDRVQRVRRAARYVFRAHPEIAKSFASGHERARRQTLRRRKAAEAATPESVASAE